MSPAPINTTGVGVNVNVGVLVGGIAVTVGVGVSVGVLVGIGVIVGVGVWLANNPATFCGSGCCDPFPAQALNSPAPTRQPTTTNPLTLRPET